ncbi:MurR/RpiR family transcriptional regulator [Planococcus sp. ISL-109]|uniref:MurR/RpiR family transcriptional regulator n=1 Tax=Planococcus sp. ISL-109 TaxID=2819166 RepID=UPI001BE9ED31|nr:MurR/RpiR family transcriptional regulator [Planococcus sp. ISL-109]MBT2582746.1 MurR/RpiR family transcriptional regulator [Planococcus sp. ISL-109]
MQDLLRNVSAFYKDFSSGQKKIADLFFREPIFLAFSPALEVGKRVNVSESTVIRWTQKLGYRGYTEFQHTLQRKLAEERLEKAQQERPATAVDQSFLENLLDADISSILKLKQTINEDNLLQVVDRISRAEQRYVTGNFFDFGLAEWFGGWLTSALGDTSMMQPGTAVYYRQMADLGPNDTVIAFAFPRYTRTIIETLEYARQRGAAVIVLTDREDSPAAKYAETVLTVSVNTNLNIDSYTAVHALLTSVMRFVYVKEHAKVKEKLAQLEAAYTDQDIFI